MMLWLWCSENPQGKDGETGNVPHCRCSPNAELRICSSQKQSRLT
ncbi:MAG: hypothetical protein ACYSSI_03050 [Planctomycetota bacterium]